MICFSPDMLELYRRLDPVHDPVEMMRHSAFHKAGHAVVAASFGHLIGNATIQPDVDNKTFGSVEMKDPLYAWQRGDGPRRKLARDYATVLLAGSASEAFHLGNVLVPSSADDEDVFDTIRLYGVRSGDWWKDGVIERIETSWRKRAATQVYLHSLAIIRVAYQLLLRITLTPEQLAALMRGPLTT